MLAYAQPKTSRKYPKTMSHEKREFIESEYDFLLTFPRSTIQNETVFWRLYEMSRKHWDNMTDRLKNIIDLTGEIELGNEDERSKAIARYCMKKLQDEFGEYLPTKSDPF